MVGILQVNPEDLSDDLCPTCGQRLEYIMRRSGSDPSGQRRTARLKMDTMRYCRTCKKFIKLTVEERTLLR